MKMKKEPETAKKRAGKLSAAAEELAGAFTVGDEKPLKYPLIYKIIR